MATNSPRGIGSGLWPLLMRDLRIFYGTPAILIFYIAVPLVIIYLYHGATEQMLGTSKAAQQLVPGFAIFFSSLLAGPLAAHIAMQRQSGYWMRLLVAPIWRPSIILAMAFSTLSMGLIQTLILFAFGRAAYDMSLGDNYPALVLVVVAYLTVPVGFGLLIASLTDDIRQQGQLITPVVALFSALGGALFVPWFLLPNWVQDLRYVSPHYWAMKGFADLMVEDKGWVATLPCVAILGLFGLIPLVLGLARFQKRSYL